MKIVIKRGYHFDVKCRLVFLSYVLLAIYSFILLASGLHTHHPHEHQTTIDAVAQWNTTNPHSRIIAYDDCGLCKLLHTTYVQSEFLLVTRIETLLSYSPTESVYSVYCPYIATCCLRAPPVFEL